MRSFVATGSASEMISLKRSQQLERIGMDKEDSRPCNNLICGCDGTTFIDLYSSTVLSS